MQRELLVCVLRWRRLDGFTGVELVDAARPRGPVPSVLQERLPPGEAVVGSVREGEDGRVHQLPHPRVPLLLAAAEAQVGNLDPKRIEVTS